MKYFEIYSDIELTIYFSVNKLPASKYFLFSTCKNISFGFSKSFVIYFY